MRATQLKSETAIKEKNTNNSFENKLPSPGWPAFAGHDHCGVT
jgi:hypothetical protein